MIVDVLKELAENQNYCMVVTCDYPLEGFVTGVKDENVLMYIFSTKNLDDEMTDEAAVDAMEDRILERVIFPVSCIEYIYPDHYKRLTLMDLEIKKLLKNQILGEAKAGKPSKKAKKKKDDQVDPA